MKTKLTFILMMVFSINLVSNRLEYISLKTLSSNSKIIGLQGQKAENLTYNEALKFQSINNYPEKFEIDYKDYERLLRTKQNKTIKTENVYLNSSFILLNTKVIENTQLKVKLSYFKKAYLIIQINGNDSRQIFIVSDDNSVFYSGEFGEDKIVMMQCKKDDLFVE